MDGDVEELVKGIETAFDVRLVDDLDNESTLADVLCALQSHLGSGYADRCLSSIVFYRLRRTLIDVIGVERAAIRPATDLTDLIPAIGRRRTWSRVGNVLGLTLPGLEYGKVGSHLILFGSLALATGAVLWGALMHWATMMIMAIPLLFAILILSSMVLFYIFKPLATKIPDHSRTAGDAVKSIVGLNHAKLVREFGPSREKELWEALRYVVMDMTGAQQYMVQAETNILDLVEETLLRAPA